MPDNSPQDSQTSYEPDYFSKLYAIEDQHFWFTSRNKLIFSIVKKLVAKLPPGYDALEVGCGTGNVLRYLAQACVGGEVVGMDLFIEGLRFARQRVSQPLVQGDLHAPPFKAQFELIGLFDVLEHLPDDVNVLGDLYKMLLPNGTLIITVPAFMSLWSYFDEESHHARRYSRSELTQKLNQAGYQVDFISYYMMSIFPLVWLGRRLAAVNKKEIGDSQKLTESELRITPIVNEVLRFVLMQEARIVAGYRGLPFGTSLIAVVHKAKVTE